MASTTNYYNRSVDLCIFHGIKDSRQTTVKQSLFDDGGYVCTGIQKLIQRWIIKFLTPIGSMKFHPTWGTSFLEDATSFRSETAAELAFYSANMDACDQLRAEEDDSMLLEEQIDNVKLNYITVNSTGFTLNITITSKFGTSAPLVLPISINPLQL